MVTQQRNLTEDEFQRILDENKDLAEVQQIAKVGGMVIDLRDGLRNYRSPGYLMIHGLPPTTVNENYAEWSGRLHPDDRTRAETAFLDVLHGSGEFYSSEYRIIRQNDGQTRWIAAEGRIERAEDGRPVRMVGAHIDITDRTIARELLRESEERFRLIADSAPVPIWVTKLDRKRAFANQAYLDFLGVGYQEALDFDWRTILHPDDAARVVRESIAGEASLKPFVLEARYRGPDRAWHWMRSESQPRWDPSGQHIGFIGVAHDVTVAKQAEAELRRLNDTLEERIRERTAQLQASEVQMRAIFETSNQYQGLLDLSGNVIYANKEALSGIAAGIADVEGRPFWDTPWFAATDGVPQIVRDAFRSAARGERVQTEMLLHLPAGDRYFEFSARPIEDQTGAITGVLTEALDVTERRRSEEALRQSQKMEAVGQLTGGVAHDFNNLLTIIRSATDFLRRRDLDESRRRRYVEAISETVDRASKLTAQLLAFARRQPLMPQVFDVGAQVESVAQLLRPLAGSRVIIETTLCDPACYAVADVAQFETALLNLAVNARDAMNGEGRLSIVVSTAQAIPALRGAAARDGNVVAVSVADVGCGIPPGKLDEIFEPFYTTKEVGKGTGLGLSQAFGFAKQSGGDIEVLSEVGVGSTFIIYLPEASRPADSQQLAPSPHPTSSGVGHRVLVVEDNEDVGRFCTELLRDLGYRVELVASGMDALAMLAHDELAWDLVFSDVIMPGMTGLELATTIRDRYPALPVVLTSGYSDVLAENADRGFELIQKPYSVESVSRVLRKAMAQGATSMSARGAE